MQPTSSDVKFFYRPISVCVIIHVGRFILFRQSLVFEGINYEISFLLICVFTFALPIYAQKENLSKDEKRVQKEITKKEREQIEKMLKTYTVCPTSETEFVVLGVRRVDKNTNHTLARETADGVKGISRTDSYDVLVTFKDKTRFANLRPDRSDPKQYETDKKVALENLQYYNNTGKFMSSSKPEEKLLTVSRHIRFTVRS